MLHAFVSVGIDYVYEFEYLLYSFNIIKSFTFQKKKNYPNLTKLTRIGLSSQPKVTNLKLIKTHFKNPRLEKLTHLSL